MRIRVLAFVCVCALVLGPAAIAQPAGRSLSAAQAQVNRAGEALSKATEAYNAARLRRARLDARLKGAKNEVATSQRRLASARGELGRQARLLYMYPARGLTAFFSSEGILEFERGSIMAGRVVGSEADAILAIRRAQADAASKSGVLQRLRDQARSQEAEIERERKTAESALQEAQNVLRTARARYGAELDSARARRLAEAGATADRIIRNVRAPRPEANVAIRFAANQIGKPYRWGGAGPDSYDCSGLTMRAWGAAGVSLPHSSKAQYSSLPHVPIADMQPGDLVFFGRPIHHVGIYIGGGRMIAAPRSGESVREESVWRNPVGVARP